MCNKMCTFLIQILSDPMTLLSLILAILAVLVILLLFYLVEWRVTQVFGVSEDTTTNLYQGGETIRTQERGYQLEKYPVSIFFLLLHVIGFFTATIYVLPLRGYNPLNGMSLIFGAIIIYTVIVIKQGTR